MGDRERVNSPPACHLGLLERGKSGVRVTVTKWRNLPSRIPDKNSCVGDWYLPHWHTKKRKTCNLIDSNRTTAAGHNLKIDSAGYMQATSFGDHRQWIYPLGLKFHHLRNVEEGEWYNLRGDLKSLPVLKSNRDLSLSKYMFWYFSALNFSPHYSTQKN